MHKLGSTFGENQCPRAVGDRRDRDDCFSECDFTRWGRDFPTDGVVQFEELIANVKYISVSRPDIFNAWWFPRCLACVRKLEVARVKSFERVDNKDKTWRNAMFSVQQPYCHLTDGDEYQYNGYSGWHWSDYEEGVQQVPENCEKGHDDYSSMATNVFYLTDYGNDMHCYHYFASECKYGVDVWIRQMRIETSSSGSSCPFDYIAFGYVKDDKRFLPQKNHRFCGCLEDRPGLCNAAAAAQSVWNMGLDPFSLEWSIKGYSDHEDLKEHNPFLYRVSDFHDTRRKQQYNVVPTTFSLTKGKQRSNKHLKIMGSDPVFTFRSDQSLHGGEVVIEWKCMSQWVNQIMVRFKVKTYGLRTLRSSILMDMKAALLSDAKRVNPYGKSGDSVVKVTMSADGTEINVLFELNGIPDENGTIDAGSISSQVSNAAQATLSKPKFSEIVDASTISVKVKLPATVTNTEEMAEKILVGTKFTSDMATNYGCASEGFFEPFTKVHGKSRDATDAEFFKWKKCVQCALGGAERIIPRYDYNEEEEVCGETNRALCECDLKLMTYLKDAEPSDGPFDLEKCTTAEHQSQLECCNWEGHYWAAFNRDHFECTSEGPKKIGDF